LGFLLYNAEKDIERRLSMTPNYNTPPQNYTPQWDRYTKILVTLILLVSGVYALTLLAPVFQLLTIAFVLAFLMYAPVNFVTRYTPIPWAAAVMLLYLFLIVVSIFVVLILSPALVRGVNSLAESGEQTFISLQNSMRDYETENGIMEVFGTNVDFNPIIVPIRNFVLGTPEVEVNPDDPMSIQSIDLRQIVDSFINVAGTVTSTLTTAIGGIVGFLSTLLLAIFISALVLIDLPNNQQTIERWIPADYHRETRMLVKKVVYVWNGFFRGQVSIGIFIGLLTWIQLKLMGINNAEILALITGLISLIPTIGGIIALLPLGIVPLLQGSTVFTEASNLGVAVLVIFVNLVINQVIWNLVAPKILGDALELPLPVIIVGVFIGAAVGGVLGAFLVAPAMGTIRVLVVYALNKLAGRDPFPEPEEPLVQVAPQPLSTQQIQAIATN
jgi:predicted PurR-regulated permease PerM